MRSKVMLALLCGTSALAVCSSGWAQSATAQNTSEPSAAIETVVVTATKRSESVQKVPLSITAMSGDETLKLGITDYDSLIRDVPGILNTGGPNVNKVVIRGIQTENGTSSVGEEKTVALYLDDLPVTSFSVITPDINPYDINRVEVLRGPQGTLFGSGSMGGAVRYVTNKPDAAGFQATVDVDGALTSGGSPRGRVNGMVNIPLIDDELAVRIVAYDHYEGGWVDNVLTGQKSTNSRLDWGFRGSLRWQPNDRLTATLTISDDVNINGDSGFYDPALGVNKSNTDFPFRVWVNQKSFNVAVDYDLGWADLQTSTTYAPGFNRWNLDLDTVLRSVLPYYYGEKIHTDSIIEDTRLVSKNDGPFNWIFGVYYLSQNSNHYGGENIPKSFLDGLAITGLPEGQSETYGKNVRLYDISRFYETHNNLEEALYGEASYQISPTVKATVGMRASITNFTVNDPNSTDYDSTGAVINAVLGGGHTAVPLTPTGNFRSSTGNKMSTTPKFTIQWQPDENQNYYVLAAQGFRRGQPNGWPAHNNGGKSTIDPSDPTIIPLAAASDTLWNYEVGAKTMWFDNRLKVNAALYYIDWRNMQVALIRTSDGDPFVGNIGKARSYGLELETDARPIEPLGVGLNLTLQKANVTALTAQQALISGAVLGASLSSPETKVGGYIEYDWSVGNLGKMYVRFEAQYVGSYTNTFPNSPGTGAPNSFYKIVPSYDNENFSLGWTRDNIRTTLYVENLLDRDTPIFVNAANFSTGTEMTLRPRTVGVRLGYTY